MYYVYVIKSQNSGKHYTGHNHNLEYRLVAHNSGYSPYTRGRGPWELAYHEVLETTAEVMEREKYLKTGKGREFIKNIHDSA